MICNKCNKENSEENKFCNYCGQKFAGYTTTTQLSRTIFVFLCFVFLIPTAFIIYLISGITPDIVGELMALASAPVIIGFYIAKVVTNNDSRTFIEIIAFQIIMGLESFAHLVLGIDSNSLLHALFTFCSSALFFWLRNKKIL